MALKKIGQDVVFLVNGVESEYLKGIKKANADAKIDTTSPPSARAGMKTTQLGTSDISYSCSMMYPAAGEAADPTVTAILAAQAARTTVTVKYDDDPQYTMQVTFGDTSSEVDAVKETAVTFILMEAPAGS